MGEWRGGGQVASKLPRSSHKGPRWQQRSAPIRRLLIPPAITPHSFVRNITCLLSEPFEGPSLTGQEQADHKRAKKMGDYADLDLAGLQLKCNEKTDETLESTRRMVEMCSEAKDAGIKTLVALDDQGEQLDKIEGGMDQINSDMGLAEKALKGMDMAFGIIPKFWKKNEGFKEDKEVWGEVKATVGAAKTEGVEIREGAYVAKITNDDREEEMEENMEQVE